MRNMKFITFVGLMLVVGVTAQAGSIPFTHAWTGPVYAHVADYSSGTFYDGTFVTGAAAPVGVVLLPGGGLASDGNVYPALTKIVGNGSQPGEDTWGVFSIDALYEGRVPNPAQHNEIAIQNQPNPLFVSGTANKELAGIFHGRVDNGVTFNGDGSSTTFSTGDKLEVYLQPVGTFDNGTAGSSGRLAAGQYKTVGFTALNTPVVGSTLVLQGVDQAGFLGTAFLPGTEEISQFFPAGDSPGHADLFISLTGALATDNPIFDQNYFIGVSNPAARADLKLHVTTTVNNAFNDPAAVLGTAYDWTVTSSDPLTGDITTVPEPVTMMGLVLGIGGLAGYIRRRRA